MRRAMAQQRQRQGRDEPRSKECSGRHQGNLWSWGVAFFFFLSFFLVSSLGLGEGNGLGGNSVFSIALSRSPFLLFCVFLYFGGYVFPVGLLAPPCNKRMALLLLTQSSLLIRVSVMPFRFPCSGSPSVSGFNSSLRRSSVARGSRTGCFGLAFPMPQRAQLPLPYDPSFKRCFGVRRSTRLQITSLLLFCPRRDWVW